MIHLQKRVRLEDRGQATLAIATGVQKGKRTGKQAKKTVSWKNQSQDTNTDNDEAWLDEPEPTPESSNEPIRGRNEEVVSRTCAVISVRVMLITYTAILR